MRQRAGRGLIGRIQFIIRNRPLLAIVISVVSLLVLVSAITITTPLRCGPARALGLKGMTSGCITVGSVGPLAHRPSPTPNLFFGNPASGPFPPINNPYPCCPVENPASGAYPPQGYPVSGSYPPFAPPASAGFDTYARPRLDCRLPVYAGPPGSGGFIVFPGGKFIADPNSNVTVPATSPTAPPVGGPGPGYGQGYGSLSYDHQFSRWVPVPPNQVSPDGSRYAYTTGNGIYVVNVATGTQTELGDGQSWSIAAVLSDGVYAGDPNAGGLWLLAFSGTTKQITKTGYWRAATSTAAYGTATSAVPQGASNSIIRLDLKTGATQEWFSRPGSQSGVSGFDGNGHAIISVSYLNGSGTEIWIATGATSASPIAGFTNQQYGGSSGFSSYSTPVADSHGVWFAGNYQAPYGQSSTGVALYVPGSGFYWMSSIGGQLAGGCY
jgi:hypothetical protein